MYSDHFAVRARVVFEKESEQARKVKGDLEVIVRSQSGRKKKVTKEAGGTTTQNDVGQKIVELQM